MNIGTRVHHRRYGFLVGTIVGRPSPLMAEVKWENYIGMPCSELLDDIRATPAQP